MASTMAANGSSVHNVSRGWTDDWSRTSLLIQALQVRSGRSNMSSSGMNGDRARGSHGNNVGKGFGTGKSSWNSNIWGDSNLGGGFADGRWIALFSHLHCGVY